MGGEGVFETNNKIFRFELKQTETKSVLVDFRFVSRNKKFFVSTQPKQIDLFWNKPKKNEKSNLKTRVSKKQTKKMFGSNQKKAKLIGFGWFLVCSAKPNKNFWFRSFWSFESVSKQPKELKQTDQFRNKSKKRIKHGGGGGGV
jgi:hypothetical protein